MAMRLLPVSATRTLPWPSTTTWPGDERPGIKVVGAVADAVDALLPQLCQVAADGFLSFQ